MHAARGARTAGRWLLASLLLLSGTLIVGQGAIHGTRAAFTAGTTGSANVIANASLAAPTGVSAQLLADGQTVALSWTATTSSFAAGYRMYRATVAGGPYTQAVQVSGAATTTGSDVPGSGAFHYVVRAYYGTSWESPNSTEVGPFRPLDHFTFGTVGAQRHNVAFGVTITAKASDNSTVTAFTGSAALSVNSGTISPTTTGAFVLGTITPTVTITGPYTTSETITASVSAPAARTGTSNGFTLNRIHATAIAITNKTGGTAGKAENGDLVVLTFSEAVTKASMGTCSSGTTNTGTDLKTNNANPDTLTASGTKLTFGTIGLGNNGSFTSSGSAGNSTCAWNVGQTVLTITFVTVTGAGTVSGSSTATYTPAAAITSLTGETIDTTTVPSVTAVLF